MGDWRYVFEENRDDVHNGQQTCRVYSMSATTEPVLLCHSRTGKHYQRVVLDIATLRVTVVRIGSFVEDGLDFQQ